MGCHDRPKVGGVKHPTSKTFTHTVVDGAPGHKDYTEEPLARVVGKGAKTDTLPGAEQ